jgi:hypothetical protein
MARTYAGTPRQRWILELLGIEARSLEAIREAINASHALVRTMRTLEAAGLVRRIHFHPPAPDFYTLTPAGFDRIRTPISERGGLRPGGVGAPGNPYPKRARTVDAASGADQTAAS